MSVKARLATVILQSIQKVLNKDVDVKGIQKKYHADRDRILCIHLTDVNLAANFKITNGKVEMIATDKPNATVYMDMTTLITLIRGEVNVEEQDGTKSTEPYTPFDAWRRGDLTIKTNNPNESWLSDLTLFGKEIYSEAFPILKKRLKL